MVFLYLSDLGLYSCYAQPSCLLIPMTSLLFLDLVFSKAKHLLLSIIRRLLHGERERLT
jgi:hypothetical protein